jgi:hypothetical protein
MGSFSLPGTLEVEWRSAMVLTQKVPIFEIGPTKFETPRIFIFREAAKSVVHSTLLPSKSSPGTLSECQAKCARRTYPVLHMIIVALTCIPAMCNQLRRADQRDHFAIYLVLEALFSRA